MLHRVQQRRTGWAYRAVLQPCSSVAFATAVALPSSADTDASPAARINLKVLRYPNRHGACAAMCAGNAGL